MLKAMSHAAIGLNFHSSPNSQAAATHTTSPVVIAFTLGILICFIVGFCFIYLCRCCFMHYLYAWAFHRPTTNNLFRQIHSPAAGASPIRGLDPALLQFFPIFPYATVKELQGKNNNNNNKNKRFSLECAICLLEFEEESVLRLLTVCCHVFHQECIDLWLESHKTCPVCRTDLDSSSKEKRQNQTTIIEQPVTAETNHNNSGNNENENETRIDVKEQEGEGEEDVSGRREEEEEEEEKEEEEEDKENNKRFPRSHSTGHSIVVIKGEENDDDDDDDDENYHENEEDKHTLKLPEHVQIKLIRGHGYAKSCASYKEMARLYSKCCYAEAISTCTTTATSSCKPIRV